MQPHRQQPTRLPRSWDSPGKNTGVGWPFPSPMHESEREVTQLCLTLCDPMDCSLLGSSVHGIFQARVLEWGAIAFSAKILICAITVWMASPTLWTWVWASSGSWWWTGKLGVLVSGVAKNRTWLSDWTELNWICARYLTPSSVLLMLCMF